MRKINLMIFILSLLVLACSSTTLFPATPTPLPPATAVPLPTETLPVASAPMPSLTPTEEPSPTFTVTPASSETATVAPTETTVSLNTIQPTSTSSTQPTPQGPVFESVMTSGTQIYWGRSCTANTVTFTAQVASGFDVASVQLFIRLQSQIRILPAPWNIPLTMHNDGLGTFTYDLAARGITHFDEFQVAWVQYQLVAVNSQKQTVGRTQVYQNNLTITQCP
ncbi:MAG: hypothetical protein WCA79_05580 [Anaerolineales bacterium]